MLHLILYYIILYYIIIFAPISVSIYTLFYISILQEPLFTDNGKEGKLATMHVMVTGLALLHKKCLIMEDTTKGRQSC